jgi:hypothetical protein
MIDTTKKYRTRDGRKARIIATGVKHHNYPVVALIEDEEGKEFVQTYTKDLKPNALSDYPSLSDLVEYHEPKVIWVNEYEGEGYSPHSTREEAIDRAVATAIRVAVKYIEAIDEESTPK